MILFFQTGQIVYPEYAVLVLVPPGNRDLSMIHVRDSQTNIIKPASDPHALRDFVLQGMVEKSENAHTNARMNSFLHDSTAKSSPDQHIGEVQHANEPGSRPGSVGIHERRDSNLGAILQHGRSRRRGTSQVMFNILATQQRNSMGAGVEHVRPLPASEMARRTSSKDEEQHNHEI